MRCSHKEKITGFIYMFPSFVVDNEIPLEKEKETEPFRLPIQYLDSAEVHVLNNIVAIDLELEKGTEEDKKTMYHYLMNPKTPFEEKMIPLWKNHYTTNKQFLKESQSIIKSMGSVPIYSPDHEEIMTIWKDTKEDPHFLERYSYMELEMFKWVNTMPSYLQATSIVNMGSPILSFLIPVVLFLMPFFIVKIQGHSITFSTYLSVLKEISRNHFIGKILNNAQEFSFQSIAYLFALVGLYLYQIYQNYIACSRFYANISRINEQISKMQQYLTYTTNTMNTFGNVIKGKSTYDAFYRDMMGYCDTLRQLGQNISCVQPFTPSFSKIGEIGTLMGCYYELYSNKEYERALLYSFSFHGYIQNLHGLFENLMGEKIHFATFDTSGSLVIKEQYYPALVDGTFVTNDVDLKKNAVITGPNAAGKTTYLKSTMLNVIFTQQFGCGFYSECAICPYTHIHSYLNIPDTSGRDSLFQAESRRCKEIIDCVVTSSEGRHFCIFDELYSGTNPVEATKSAYAFLMWLSKRDYVDFMLTTQYVDICGRWKKVGARITNWKMDAEQNEDGDITYTYRLVRGVSKIQGAIKVLRDMEYPAEIMDTIANYDVVKKGDE